MRTVLRPLALVVAALLLAACQPGEAAVNPNDQVAAANRIEETPAEGEGEGGGGGGGPVVTWVGAPEIAWESTPESPPAGPVTVEIACAGSLPHNIVIEGLNGEEPIAECAGNDTATGQAELEPATDYTYHCSVPGHQSLMTGEMTTAQA